MHFSKGYLAGLVVGLVVALPVTDVVKRDLPTIQSAIESVQTALGGLSTAVKAVTDDPNTAAPILQASTDVQNAIQKAQTDIAATEALSLGDALQLQQVAGGLTTAVQSTISDLTAKKPTFDQLGVSSIVLQSLQQQKTDSAALGGAIVSKVPGIGQGIAQQSIDQITAALDEGIQAFSAGGNATAPAPVPNQGATPETPTENTPPVASSPARAPPTNTPPAETPANENNGNNGDGLGGLLGGLLGGAGGAGGAGGLGGLLGGLLGAAN